MAVPVSFHHASPAADGKGELRLTDPMIWPAIEAVGARRDIVITVADGGRYRPFRLYGAREGHVVHRTIGQMLQHNHRGDALRIEWLLADGGDRCLVRFSASAATAFHQQLGEVLADMAALARQAAHAMPPAASPASAPAPEAARFNRFSHRRKAVA